MGKNSSRHFLAVAVACAIWGGSVIGTKLSYDSLAPMSLGLMRFSFSAILFFALLAIKRELTPPQGRDLALIAASGLLGTTLYFAAENYGASLASGATSSLVIGSFPAMTLVLESVVDHTMPKPRVASGVLLAFVGVCVLALAENGATGADELLGMAILMAGGICWAIYNLMMRSLAGRRSPLVITAWQTLFGALGFVPLAAIEGAPIRGLSGVAAASLAYLVVCCTVAGFSLYNYGFEELSPSVVSSLVNLTPLVGLALSALILGEQISVAQFVGGAIVIAGIALSSLPSGEQEATPRSL
ncbi:MAG: DMT family transporter [Atopobiaceae bacterium]|nr:DMT family transporter [Atopobiaceae bacterium]